MNLSNNIYFDGDLLKVDSPTKVIYSGFLAEKSPNYIYMHYGYGIVWDNLQEVKLFKGISGYESDVTFTEFGDVNFCFRDSEGVWDNNDGNNYKAKVEKNIPDIPKSDSMALVELPKLKTAFLINRKIKITFYRIISFIGKLFSGKILRKTAK